MSTTVKNIAIGIDTVTIELTIPSTTCGLCRTVYQHEVSIARIRSAIVGKHAIDDSFCTPPDWEHWRWVYDARAAPNRTAPALVCPKCAAPLTEAEAASEQSKRDANAAIGAKLWPEVG